MVDQCLNDVSLINFRLEDITSDENKLQQNSAGLFYRICSAGHCEQFRSSAVSDISGQLRDFAAEDHTSGYI